MSQYNKINMLQRRLLGLSCLYLAFILMPNQAVARIKYGLWEITIKMQMDAMPVDNPQQTFKKCISRKNLTPGNSEDKQGCDKDKVTRKKDTVNWTVSCSRDKHTMTGNGLVVYSGNSMTGNAQFQVGGKGLATMNMKLQYQGKRLGKCK